MELWQLSGIPAAPNLARAIRHKQFSLSCVWSNPAIQQIPSPHGERLVGHSSVNSQRIREWTFYETFMPLNVKWEAFHQGVRQSRAKHRRGGASAMKRIDAIIREQNFDNVKTRLSNIGIEGLTVAEVKGFGQQKRTEFYRGIKYQVPFFPKLLLTIIARDDQVSEILEAIVEGARTGNIGDGKVFVSSLEEVVRIRSGEIGEAAV